MSRDDDIPAEGSITFRLHPVKDADDSEVNAVVFGVKLAQFARAIEAADEAKNGARVHDLTIAKLHTSRPTAILRETEHEDLVAQTQRVAVSGIHAFRDCCEFIKQGSEKAFEYGSCINKVRLLTAGASHAYGFGEAVLDKGNVIRIDNYLRDRTNDLIQRRDARVPATEWFRGTSIGTFDGVLSTFDGRGSAPLLTLALSAGGAEIECVGTEDQLPIIRRLLKLRTRITGKAIYDGSSGLPQRIEILSLDEVVSADFTRWRGAVEEFEQSEWAED